MVAVMLMVTILAGGFLCLLVGGVEDGLNYEAGKHEGVDDGSNDEAGTHGLDESR